MRSIIVHGTLTTITESRQMSVGNVSFDSHIRAEHKMNTRQRALCLGNDETSFSSLPSSATPLIYHLPILINVSQSTINDDSRSPLYLISNLRSLTDVIHSTTMDLLFQICAARVLLQFPSNSQWDFILFLNCSIVQPDVSIGAISKSFTIVSNLPAYS